MKLSLLLICFFTGYALTFSQNQFSFRIIIDNSLTATSTTTSIEYLHGYTDETHYPKETGYCTGIGLSVNYNFNEDNAVDIRAGYLWATFSNYNGPEFCFNYKRRIIAGFSALAGLKAHIAFPSNPDRTEHTVTFAGLGAEYNLDSIFSFEITFNKPLSNLYFRGGELPQGISKIHYDLRFTGIMQL